MTPKSNGGGAVGRYSRGEGTGPTEMSGRLTGESLGPGHHAQD